MQMFSVSVRKYVGGSKDDKRAAKTACLFNCSWGQNDNLLATKKWGISIDTDSWRHRVLVSSF